MNMSYCRFRNTLLALRDCSGALEDMMQQEERVDLSPEERAAAKELAQEARDLVIMLAEQVAVCDATIRRMDRDLTDDVLAGAIDLAADGVEAEEAEAEEVQS